MTTTRRILIGLCMTATLFVLFAALATAQMKTTENIQGTAKTSTQELKGTVLYVAGNTLVAKMSNGETRMFNIQEGRKFIIDGEELSINQLQVGTTLTATITTTNTPVTVRTKTVIDGRVWYVGAPYVILTLTNGENKQYKVPLDVTLTADGKPSSVFRLKKGMTVHAERIVEEPTSEIAMDTRIVGQAPPPPPVKTKAEPAPAPSRARVTKPAPEPAVAAASPEPKPAKQKLPGTASPYPLMGLLGLLFVSGSFGIRMFRRS
jgi:hypothetical protein